MSVFTIERDTGTHAFRIIAPDGTDSEWYADGELANVEYNGKTYVGTNGPGYTGMKENTVYPLAFPVQTKVMDYDGGEDDDGDDLDDDNDADDNDAGLECPECEAVLELE